MPAYHQMGHDSKNLLTAEHLTRFQGAVLSPVNYDEQDTKGLVEHTKSSKGHFDFIFDPQLYVPHSDRGVLKNWDYFPSDIDTADISVGSWWNEVNSRLINSLQRVGVECVCSPAIIPKRFSGTDYYASMIHTGDQLKAMARDKGVEVYHTVVVSLNDLSDAVRAMEIASVVSTENVSKIYLIILSDIEPRREYSSAESLRGIMTLIRQLSQSGIEVLVGYCSTDVALWKFAGAHSCASGKFFNLRRFTTSRFEEPTSGGGQLPYFVEQSLFAFLRQADLLRVQDRYGLPETTRTNPYTQTILDSIQANDPWLAQSWRHFLYWFSSFVYELDNDASRVPSMLQSAERLWLSYEDDGFLMDEPRNDGSWIRPWRIAISDML